MKTIVLLLLAIATLGQAQSNGPGLGSIQGIVVEQDGKPLAGADVYGLPESDMIHPIRAKADILGRFRLTSLPAGVVYLEAAKEDDGYPYSTFAFFTLPGYKEPNKVIVKAGETTSGAIRMGLRAASLTVVIRGDQGEMVPSASFEFTRADMPHGSLKRSSDSGGTTKLFVPPVPFSFSVEAPDYQIWDSGKVELKPSEARTITVTMHRSDPK